jgi:hypothetical protein
MTRVLLLGIALPACVLNGDKYAKPSELAPSWAVENTRVLGIQAEPPEVGPGESVSFDALIGQPMDATAPLVRTWFACPTTEDGVGLGCTFDANPDELMSDSADFDALLDAGLIGVQPGWDPLYQTPLDLLDSLPEEERSEGSYVLVQLAVLDAETENEPTDQLDPGDMAIAYKRVVVSEAATPNHNPTLDGFDVEGFAVEQDEVVYVDPGQPYELGIRISDASVETYTFLNGDGVAEERIEEPYVAWYTTGGTLRESVTLYPYTQADWISPKRSGIDGLWYAVARDRRGGMVWWSQPWKTR